MDHLTRLFLELEQALDSTSGELPQLGQPAFLPRQSTADSTAEGRSAVPASEEGAVKALSRLLEEGTRARELLRPIREPETAPSFSAAGVAAAAASGKSAAFPAGGRFSLAPEAPLTPEEISRIFERDARRY